MTIPIRPRRRRRSKAIRRLVREMRLSPDRLVLPLFILDGENRSEPIEAIPGNSRTSIDETIRTCEQALKFGIASVCIFPVVPQERKCSKALEALNENNLVARSVRALKKKLPELCIITDVALDPYNSDGHDGLVSDAGIVLNDETVEMLAKMSVLHAQAGADIVAPSDMMDGRIGAIRDALDDAGHIDTLLLSYAAKYASAFYGPFRSALDSAPTQGAHIPKDKRTYQMDPANAREAIIEAELDEAEGADILMVKPGLPYLDIIARLRAMTDLPIAAYHVSGEYAMLQAAADRGWLDAKQCLAESLQSMARAGADIIFTYGAVEYAKAWHEDPLAGASGD